MKTQCVLLSFALLVSIAGAGTVTFDNFSPLDTCMSPVSSEGLTFTAINVCQGRNAMYVWDGSAPNSNGTPGLIYGFQNFVAVTPTAGGVFSLKDFQMTISFYDDSPSENIQFTAHFQGGGTTSETLTLIQGLQTYDMNLFNLTEFDLGALPVGSDGYWLLDNIDYGGSVPEPGTFTLLGSGLLLGFGVLRRWTEQQSIGIITAFYRPDLGLRKCQRSCPKSRRYRLGDTYAAIVDEIE